ncbi:MAG TPA: 50S ribosomal protein L21 [Candidatus Moranbacteria bacterium]|nr:50S ribosomal protein L21 [Candidatus Moranbacteria bacterium]
MLAVVKTGGKQYLVREGQIVAVEKLSGKEGEKIDLTEVLLLVDGKKVALGDPQVKGARVEGKILRHFRADKLWGIKHKPKKRYKKKFGHRQELTEVEIVKISAA